MNKSINEVNDVTRTHWAPILEKLSIPEDRKDFALAYIENFHARMLAETAFSASNERYNKLPIAIDVIKRLDLDGVIAIATAGPVYDYEYDDNQLYRMMVGTLQIAPDDDTPLAELYNAIADAAVKTINSELAERKGEGKRIIFCVYTLPSLSQTASLTRPKPVAHFRYAIKNVENA